MPHTCTVPELKDKILSFRDYFRIVDDAIIIVIRDPKINVVRARPNGLDFIKATDIEIAQDTFPHWNCEWIWIERREKE